MLMYETWVIFLMVYLLPLLMILMGFLYKLFPPAFNSVWGYRSQRARESKSLWRFAQESFSKKIILAGILVMCVMAFANMLLLLYQPVVNVAAVLISLLSFGAVCLLVERELKGKAKH